MSDSSPISLGSLPSTPRAQNHRVLAGALIHAGCVLIACFLAPLVGGSNIWPIAGVFWSVFTVPVAAGTGALTGWMVQNRSPAVAFFLMTLAGIGLAVIAGVVMASNQ